tara:strand:- start:672 stop:995 length:324 start_codon:yes stop_codon:yes gene_type:complete
MWDVEAARNGADLVPELQARGRWRRGMSLQEQRRVFDASVYGNAFGTDGHACREIAQWRAKQPRRPCVAELVKVGRTWLKFLGEHGMCAETRRDVADAVLSVVRQEL